MLTLIPRGPAEAGPVLPISVGAGGATLGRAAGVDLVLPDPRSIVSSRHCRIDVTGENYILTDTSTNGTAVNGRRMTAPHRLAEGDVLTIGPWEVGVTFASASAPPPRPGADGWNRQPGPPAAAPAGATMQAPARPAQGIRPPQAPLPPGADAVTQLLHAAGIPRTAIQAGDAAVLAAAGALLRQFGSGLMAMLEARAKARAELGVKPGPASTNPLKRPGKAEPAVAQLLGAPQAAERAVAEAFAELNAHQHATLKAMQGALRSTLDDLAPEAIRKRANGGGDAALWKAYAAAFGGSGNDSHFVEVFAQELAKSYEKLAGDAAH